MTLRNLILTMTMRIMTTRAAATPDTAPPMTILSDDGFDDSGAVAGKKKFAVKVQTILYNANESWNHIISRKRFTT